MREEEKEFSDELQWAALPAEAARAPHPDGAWGFCLSPPFRQDQSRVRQNWVVCGVEQRQAEGKVR